MKKYTYGETLTEMKKLYAFCRKHGYSENQAVALVKRAAADNMHSGLYDIDYTIKILYNEFFKA